MRLQAIATKTYYRNFLKNSASLEVHASSTSGCILTWLGFFPGQNHFNFLQDNYKNNKILHWSPATAAFFPVIKYKVGNDKPA